VIYPNSTPEFRVYIKQDGTQEFQYRYVSPLHGYTGQWQTVKVEYETSTTNT
jgi:hypothetical protein